MRLLQMTYFLTVADTGSISGAAQILYVSQPALSKQIALLEQEIGTPLLIRGARGVSLTEAGERFAADCRRILSEINEAVHKAAAIGNEGAHLLRIGCFDGAYIDDFMPDLYRHLRGCDPDLKIKLIRKTVGENRKAFQAEEIDLLIEPRTNAVPEELYPEPLEVITLIHRQGAFIYSEYSPLAQKPELKIGDFAGETMLLSASRENQIMAQRALDTLHSLGIEDPKTEPMENIMTLLSTLNLGHGYALLTRTVADTTPGLKAFILPEEYGLDIIAIWRKDNKAADSLMGTYRSREKSGPEGQ